MHVRTITTARQRVEVKHHRINDVKIVRIIVTAVTVKVAFWPRINEENKLLIFKACFLYLLHLVGWLNKRGKAIHYMDCLPARFGSFLSLKMC